MEKQKNKLTGILDSEMFGTDKTQYYFDIKKAKSQKHYLRITRRDQQDQDNFRRTEIILFEDDLGYFVEAVSMLLGRYSSGTMGISC
ncbi:MAG: DUF3276 family protein [Bacteroidota bacterium]|nr:DUF3276 family protein [Bacteroidota bacterium]